MKTVKLGNVCEKIGSGATPRGGSEVYQSSGVALIRSQNVYNDGFRKEGLAYINDKHARELENVIVQAGDVLLNITGDSVARVCQVPKDILPARVNQHVSIIRPHKDILDARYLRYFLVSPLMQQYMNALAASGATRQALTKGMIESYEIPAPPLPEQKAIASILGTLDDKIEMNTKMNETLEATARATFKSWFVDFDPIPGFGPHKEWQDSPLGRIPKGWRVGDIGNICEVRGGFAYKSETFCDNGYPVIKIKNINSGRTVNIDDVEYIPEHIALRTRDFWLSDGDLIMAMTGATVGKFGLVVNKSSVPAVLNQRVAKFFPFQEHGDLPWFIYSILQSQEIIEQVITTANGSAQPNISANGIMSPKIVIPDDQLIKLFNIRVDCIFKQIISNQRQSRTLASIRDALLPGLLSGEIRVKDAEKFL